jgi:hypothetical protein
VDKVVGDKGFGLTGWERVLAGAALIGCLFDIALDGSWRWLALPCIAILFLLTLRRTSRTDRALSRSLEDYRELVDLPTQAPSSRPSGTLLHVSRRLRESTGLVSGRPRAATGSKRFTPTIVSGGAEGIKLHSLGQAVSTSSTVLLTQADTGAGFGPALSAARCRRGDYALGRRS